MHILLNGNQHEHQDNATLAALLDAMGAHSERVATMVNDEIVGKTERDTLSLHDNDRVEVLIFAGGG